MNVMSGDRKKSLTGPSVGNRIWIHHRLFNSNWNSNEIFHQIQNYKTTNLTFLWFLFEMRRPSRLNCLDVCRACSSLWYSVFNQSDTRSEQKRWLLLIHQCRSHPPSNLLFTTSQINSLQHTCIDLCILWGNCNGQVVRDKSWMLMELSSTQDSMPSSWTCSTLLIHGLEASSTNSEPKMNTQRNIIVLRQSILGI